MKSILKLLLLIFFASCYAEELTVKIEKGPIINLNDQADILAANCKNDIDQDNNRECVVIKRSKCIKILFNNFNGREISRTDDNTCGFDTPAKKIIAEREYFKKGEKAHKKEFSEIGAIRFDVRLGNDTPVIDMIGHRNIIDMTGDQYAVNCKDQIFPNNLRECFIAYDNKCIKLYFDNDTGVENTAAKTEDTSCNASQSGRGKLKENYIQDGRKAHRPYLEDYLKINFKFTGSNLQIIDNSNNKTTSFTYPSNQTPDAVNCLDEIFPGNNRQCFLIYSDKCIKVTLNNYSSETVAEEADNSCNYSSKEGRNSIRDKFSKKGVQYSNENFIKNIALKFDVKKNNNGKLSADILDIRNILNKDSSDSPSAVICKNKVDSSNNSRECVYFYPEYCLRINLGNFSGIELSKTKDVSCGYSIKNNLDKVLEELREDGEKAFIDNFFPSIPYKFNLKLNKPYNGQDDITKNTVTINDIAYHFTDRQITQVLNFIPAFYCKDVNLDNKVECVEVLADHCIRTTFLNKEFDPQGKNFKDIYESQITDEKCGYLTTELYNISANELAAQKKSERKFINSPFYDKPSEQLEVKVERVPWFSIHASPVLTLSAGGKFIVKPFIETKERDYLFNQYGIDRPYSIICKRSNSANVIDCEVINDNSCHVLQFDATSYDYKNTKISNSCTKFSKGNITVDFSAPNGYTSTAPSNYIQLEKSYKDYFLSAAPNMRGTVVDSIYGNNDHSFVFPRDKDGYLNLKITNVGRQDINVPITISNVAGIACQNHKLFPGTSSIPAPNIDSRNLYFRDNKYYPASTWCLAIGENSCEYIEINSSAEVVSRKRDNDCGYVSNKKLERSLWYDLFFLQPDLQYLVPDKDALFTYHYLIAIDWKKTNSPVFSSSVSVFDRNKYYFNYGSELKFWIDHSTNTPMAQASIFPDLISSDDPKKVIFIDKQVGFDPPNDNSTAIAAGCKKITKDNPDYRECILVFENGCHLFELNNESGEIKKASLRKIKECGYKTQKQFSYANDFIKDLELHKDKTLKIEWFKKPRANLTFEKQQFSGADRIIVSSENRTDKIVDQNTIYRKNTETFNPVAAVCKDVDANDPNNRECLIVYRDKCDYFKIDNMTSVEVPNSREVREDCGYLITSRYVEAKKFLDAQKDETQKIILNDFQASDIQLVFSLQNQRPIISAVGITTPIIDSLYKTVNLDFALAAACKDEDRVNNIGFRECLVIFKDECHKFLLDKLTGDIKTGSKEILTSCGASTKDKFNIANNFYTSNQVSQGQSIKGNGYYSPIIELSFILDSLGWFSTTKAPVIKDLTNSKIISDQYSKSSISSRFAAAAACQPSKNLPPDFIECLIIYPDSCRYFKIDPYTGVKIANSEEIRTFCGYEEINKYYVSSKFYDPLTLNTQKIATKDYHPVIDTLNFSLRRDQNLNVDNIKIVSSSSGYNIINVSDYIGGPYPNIEYAAAAVCKDPSPNNEEIRECLLIFKDQCLHFKINSYTSFYYEPGNMFSHNRLKDRWNNCGYSNVKKYKVANDFYESQINSSDKIQTDRYVRPKIPLNFSLSNNTNSPVIASDQLSDPIIKEDYTLPFLSTPESSVAAGCKDYPLNPAQKECLVVFKDYCSSFRIDSYTGDINVTTQSYPSDCGYSTLAKYLYALKFLETVEKDQKVVNSDFLPPLLKLSFNKDRFYSTEITGIGRTSPIIDKFYIIGALPNQEYAEAAVCQDPDVNNNSKRRCMLIFANECHSFDINSYTGDINTASKSITTTCGYSTSAKFRNANAFYMLQTKVDQKIAGAKFADPNCSLPDSKLKELDDFILNKFTGYYQNDTNFINIKLDLSRSIDRQFNISTCSSADPLPAKIVEYKNLLNTDACNLVLKTMSLDLVGDKSRNFYTYVNSRKLINTSLPTVTNPYSLDIDKLNLYNSGMSDMDFITEFLATIQNITANNFRSDWNCNINATTNTATNIAAFSRENRIEQNLVANRNIANNTKIMDGQAQRTILFTAKELDIYSALNLNININIQPANCGIVALCLNNYEFDIKDVLRLTKSLKSLKLNIDTQCFANRGNAIVNVPLLVYFDSSCNSGNMSLSS